MKNTFLLILLFNISSVFAAQKREDLKPKPVDMFEIARRFAGLNTKEQLKNYLDQLDDADRNEKTNGYDIDKLWEIINRFQPQRELDVDKSFSVNEAARIHLNDQLPRQLSREIIGLEKRIEKIKEYLVDVDLYEKALLKIQKAREFLQKNAQIPFLLDALNVYLFNISKKLEQIEQDEKTSKKLMDKKKIDLKVYIIKLDKLKKELDNLLDSIKKKIDDKKNESIKDKLNDNYVIFLEDRHRIETHLEQLIQMLNTSYYFDKDSKKYDNLNLVFSALLPRLEDRISRFK